MNNLKNVYLETSQINHCRQSISANIFVYILYLLVYQTAHPLLLFTQNSTAENYTAQWYQVLIHSELLKVITLEQFKKNKFWF